MEFIKNYQQKRDFNDIVLSFIETEDESYECYVDLSNFIKKQEFTKGNQLLQSFIDILVNIINNHHRNPDFFDKITQILQLLAKNIQEQFSNKEIFNMFSDNKRVLLILIENKIILFDQNIIDLITNNKDPFNYKLRNYFPKEIDPFLNSKMKSILKMELSFRGKNFLENNFEEKRLNGENDTYICSLIRDDLSPEFISYVNRKRLSLLTQIKPTIFETNLMLKNKSTLIEYAAFYASIEIFNYLRMSKVTLTPSLWLYSIHSNNGQLIHILEENEVAPPNNSYETCLEEAIKCHHNNIAMYILDKLQENGKNFDLQVAILCFQYKNFSFLPENLDIEIVLFVACKFGYIDIATKILETQQININYKYDKGIFNDCDSLLQLAVNSNNSELLSILFEQKGVEIQSNCFLKCTEIKELKLSESIGTIHKYAFAEFISLTSITLPNSMTVIDECTFFNCKSLSEVIIPSSVTSIGNSAFENCINLKNIILPSSLKYIGKSSFKNCENIEIIEIPPSVSIIEKGAFENCPKLPQFIITQIKSKTFTNCTFLLSIEIPHSVIEIDPYAFLNHVSLCEVIIASSVTSIGNSVFENCINLKNIILPSSLKYIGKSSFKNCKNINNIEIPPSVNIIEEGAFENCSELREIKLPQFITKINSKMFMNCTSLLSIEIPHSVIEIDTCAFLNCNSLSEVIIASSVTSIGNSVFENCINLKNIILPSSLKFIGKSSFKNCENIEIIEIPPSVNIIEKGAFENCSELREIKLPQFITKINSKMFMNCTSLLSIEIPHSVIEIGTWAFHNCRNLLSCKLPPSLMKIDKWLFFGCESLNNIIIPPVESIGQQAFCQCYSLKEIEIPESVKFIAHCAFSECKSLMNVKIRSKNCFIDSIAFERCPLLKNLEM